MARYQQKFDAAKYWAAKPLCTVCKKHKVKRGMVCSLCKKEKKKMNTATPRKHKESAIPIAASEMEKTLQNFSRDEEGASIDHIETIDEEDIDTDSSRPPISEVFSMPTSQQTERTNPISPEVQNKIARLFTYLEKALSLDGSAVRDFRTLNTPPSPWWLADLPHDVENLYIRPFETEKGAEDSDQKSGAWLRVEKKNIAPAPALPPELTEWILEIKPIDPPKAKEKIDRKIRFDSEDERVKEFKKFRKDFKQGQEVPKGLTEWVTLSPDKLPEVIEVIYVEDAWTDHPELHGLLEGYIENDWQAWAEKTVKVYKANLLYDQLYALRLLLKNEGDSYELLLGHGLLAWKHEGVGSIYAPVFLTPLTLDFDASKRVIELSPDPMFRNFVEISPLYEMANPAEMDLITWSDTINANPFDFWHFESLKAQARTLVNYLSTEGEDKFKHEIVAAPDLSNHPTIWNAPVIFARKRSNDLWSKYAGMIRRDIEQNNINPTEFITDLVGEYDAETLAGGHTEGEDVVHETSLKESELLFPLPWNDEQKRIAERVECNYGVVVKGPPGTGKSHTIANLISRFLAQGKTVLVTSQTSKALDVLRDKLPENIRSLAVSQLNQTARRDDVLQQSISEISSNLGERYTKFSEQKSESIRRDLQKVREEKATLANQIRQYILTDSSEKIEIDGELIKPIEAAQLVSKYKDDQDTAWITDKIPFDAVLNFNEEDLVKAYTLLSELDLKERDLFKFELPASSLLPNEEKVSAAFSAYRELGTKAKASKGTATTDTEGIGQEDLHMIWEKLVGAQKVLASINKEYEQEIFRDCEVSEHKKERWISAISKITEKIQTIGKSSNITLGHDISGKTDLPPEELLEAISVLKNKVSSRTKLGTLARILLPANAKTVLEVYTVDDRPPETSERIEVLQAFIAAQLAEKDIKKLVDQSFSALKNAPNINKGSIDIVELEVLISNLTRIIGYSKEFSVLADFFSRTKVLSDLSFCKQEGITAAIEFISTQTAKFELANLEKMLFDWAEALRSSVSGKQHPVIAELVEALEKRNATAWKTNFNILCLLEDKKSKAHYLNEITQKISYFAPNLYQDIASLADEKLKFESPQNLILAWKIARLESWLDHVHDHADIDALQSQLERLTKREYTLNSDLVTILAWQRQIDKVTKKQRDALMAWSDAMKKYGKGKGKHANKWLRAAQESLKEAKNAVPVWIMPLHRAAQMFSEPKPGMFDVVIFDEASQCDLKGLTIGYLGKKLLVVGDPDQISPAGIFQDLEKGFELISRFLFDIPHKDTFSINSSLFDLAKIRIPNMIQLNEHFRCVPEIIAFSNYHIYEGRLKPLRHPHPKGLLKPALVPVFIEKGYQNKNDKVNEPEAEAIVAKLVSCLNDPAYEKRPDGRPCTFGIISLLAEDQAKHIQKLIQKRISEGTITEKQIEEHRIECGDAYKFQGDERDVIFLSMVRALDSDKIEDTVAPLTSEDAKRRFNVAASRARDQMFLFHSVPLEAFGNKDDWRFKLLNWFYDPKKEVLSAGREALKREFDAGRASQFSFEVGNILIDRGYQVLPEYPVIGYRIDLVVQGEDARLAVECDGDQYHTLENWEEDQAREQQLRRAGWEFWRVTGSSFYRYREKALESLWEKLDELRIKSVISK